MYLRRLLKSDADDKFDRSPELKEGAGVLFLRRTKPWMVLSSPHGWVHGVLRKAHPLPCEILEENTNAYFVVSGY